MIVMMLRIVEDVMCTSSDLIRPNRQATIKQQRTEENKKHFVTQDKLLSHG
jgi:hypothetical protein